ncbi:hypothetical protein Q4610_06205 [Sphingobium sp. HBC34]|uniref:Uncharacterized protein n=1 Tax=Sphingobium cyanobacteriorum TaxID=3063954 RepID=A0ABT8ZJE1_9SPHN|nr:hypothetical protein [Sphingobium sp. HBC34]MDO7834634.1 hypothetical protein [Sphingobium sp. HBC34]
MLARFANMSDVPLSYAQREFAMSLRAFLGDPALKAATLKRVRDRWEARQITPLIYLKWSADSDFASLAGVIAETRDPRTFVERTGIPVELALLCETLINAGISFVDDKDAPFGFVMRGDDAIWSFGIEWLDAVAVDDDVSDVVPRFLPAFLARILSDDFPLSAHIAPGVRAAAQEIVRLWTRELRGEAIARQEWRSARASALRASETSSDPEGYLVAELVESLPWPLAGIATEFPVICQKFLHAYLHSLAAPLLPTQDQADRIDGLAGARTLSHARGEARFADASDADILDHFPQIKRATLAARQPEAMARMDDAIHRARPRITPFLREQMDRLLTLMRRTPE